MIFSAKSPTIAVAMLMMCGCATAQSSVCLGLNCPDDLGGADKLTELYTQLGAMDRQTFEDSFSGLSGFDDDHPVKQCMAKCDREYNTDLSLCRTAYTSDGFFDSTPNPEMLRCFDIARKVQTQCLGTGGLMDCL